ncbi:hypothetical protein BC833DRAFT_136285 [Globomyces pollinis-pini]|nr:hypothetical protein BC833DRAFT_136285 [Globomyces pollinis-pini]
MLNCNKKIIIIEWYYSENKQIMIGFKYTIPLFPEKLTELCQPFGSIHSIKYIPIVNSFGFIEFETEKMAKEALIGLQGAFLYKYPLKVSKAISKSSRWSSKLKKQIYVSSELELLDKTKLRKLCVRFGMVQSVYIENKSCPILITFEKEEDATRAIEHLDATDFLGYKLRLYRRKKSIISD